MYLNSEFDEKNMVENNDSLELGAEELGNAPAETSVVTDNPTLEEANGTTDVTDVSDADDSLAEDASADTEANETAEEAEETVIGDDEFELTMSSDMIDEATDVQDNVEADTAGNPAEESVSDEQNSTETNGKSSYLHYGGTSYPKGFDFDGALKFLCDDLKYDGGELSQTRKSKDGSAIINTDEKATEFCSYCGAPISTVDYYRLPDGRKRCASCSMTLIKSVEELNRLFNDVVLNLEQFFGATINVPMSVSMIEHRKLKKMIGKAVGGKPPKDAIILGVAIEKKGKFTVYLENGIPRASFIATVAHELTHIWQYTHWNRKLMKKKYGIHLLEVYEGMAKWAEIQYLYHVGESIMAKREELCTMVRDDEYGRGFIRYVDKYPLVNEIKAFLETPFGAGDEPLD